MGGGGGGAQKFGAMGGGGGGGGGGAQTFVAIGAVAHSHLGGFWGYAPPENFGILNSLRAFLRHS